MYVDHVDVQRKKDHIMYALGYLRDSLEESLHIYFSDDRASFLSAMLLGDKSGLDRKQKLMYQRNGFAHILAISGMHVSIIALAFEKLLEMLGVKVIITTADGSAGVKGFVTDALKTVDSYSYVCTCGPEPMLKAVYNAGATSGQFSFEERMGCGFGACMGCSCKTKYGNKRICKDGPVLEKEEIVW